MKRCITVVLLLLMVPFVIGCGAVSDVQMDLKHSEYYSEDELDAAAKIVRKHFRQMYNGCTLLTIQYDGDEASRAQLSYCRELEPDKHFVDCAVLTSNFETTENCDTSFEKNKIYKNWQWYLAREENGKWQLVMEGQG